MRNIIPLRWLWLKHNKEKKYKGLIKWHLNQSLLVKYHFPFGQTEKKEAISNIKALTTAEETDPGIKLYIWIVDFSSQSRRNFSFHAKAKLFLNLSMVSSYITCLNLKLKKTKYINKNTDLVREIHWIYIDIYSVSGDSVRIWFYFFGLFLERHKFLS